MITGDTQGVQVGRYDKAPAMCWRCENRIHFIETGHGPRCECGDLNRSSCSCYCYRAVRPILSVRHTFPGDKRPSGSGFMAARSRADGLASGGWACESVTVSRPYVDKAGRKRQKKVRGFVTGFNVV